LTELKEADSGQTYTSAAKWKHKVEKQRASVRACNIQRGSGFAELSLTGTLLTLQGWRIQNLSLCDGLAWRCQLSAFSIFLSRVPHCESQSFPVVSIQSNPAGSRALQTFIENWHHKGHSDLAAPPKLD